MEDADLAVIRRPTKRSRSWVAQAEGADTRGERRVAKARSSDRKNRPKRNCGGEATIASKLAEPGHARPVRYLRRARFSTKEYRQLPRTASASLESALGTGRREDPLTAAEVISKPGLPLMAALQHHHDLRAAGTPGPESSSTAGAVPRTYGSRRPPWRDQHCDAGQA